MQEPGLCDRCGRTGVLYSCMLCGRRVCRSCYAGDRRVCVECLRGRKTTDERQLK